MSKAAYQTIIVVVCVAGVVLLQIFCPTLWLEICLLVLAVGVLM